MDNANAVAEHLQQQVNALAATVQTQANTIQTLQGQVQDAQAQAAAAPRRAANQKLDKFTNSEGEDEWIFYKRHFIKTCELNGYNDQEKRTALAHAMKGKAARATVDIDVDANINGFPPTFDAVLELFDAKFLPESASQFAQARFEYARQGAQESTIDFHSRLKSLHMQAYPNTDDEAALLRKFTMGLRRRDIRMQVLRARPDTYSAALVAAHNESAVLQLAKVSELGAAPGTAEAMEIGALDQQQRAAAPAQAGGGGGAKGSCHFCNKHGHWKRDCNLLKKAKQMQQKQGGQTGAKPKWKPRGRMDRQALVAALTEALEEEEGQEEPEPAAGAKEEDSDSDF